MLVGLYDISQVRGMAMKGRLGGKINRPFQRHLRLDRSVVVDDRATAACRRLRAAGNVLHGAAKAAKTEE